MSEEKKGGLARDIVRYVRDVVRHGVGLWVGAFVTLGGWWLDRLVAAGWLGKADWWTHPSPMFYVVVGAIGVAVSGFMAWRSQRKELDASTASVQIEVSVEWENNNLLLVIRNLSPLASFWAGIKHMAGSMNGWPDHEVFARWDHQSAERAQIPKLGSHRLVAGQLQDEHRPWSSGQWSVPFTSDQKTGKAVTTASFLYGTSAENRDTIPDLLTYPL